jgi:cytoskeletal protein CcmA (bactofilin family)
VAANGRLTRSEIRPRSFSQLIILNAPRGSRKEAFPSPPLPRKEFSSMSMWGRKEEKKETPASTPAASYTPPPPPAPVKPESPKEVSPVSSMPQQIGSTDSSKGAVAHIGKSVVIRGELSGSEDLYIDGQVEGTIELREHNLTVGPNGRVNANVNAKEVIVQGAVKGNIRAIDRVEIRKSGSVSGDLVAARIVIEDGAFFKGSIDIQKGGEAKGGGSKPAESSPAAQPAMAAAKA